MSKTSYITLLYIFLTILTISVANYGLSSSGWVYIIYSDDNKNALMKSLPYIDSIAAINDDYNSITAYISDEKNRYNLIKSGAIILDPKGVPLCLTSD